MPRFLLYVVGVCTAVLGVANGLALPNLYDFRVGFVILCAVIVACASAYLYVLESLRVYPERTGAIMTMSTLAIIGVNLLQRVLVPNSDKIHIFSLMLGAVLLSAGVIELIAATESSSQRPRRGTK